MRHSLLQKAATSNASNTNAAREASQPAFEDRRPGAAAQLKLQEMVDNSKQVQQLKAIQSMSDGATQVAQLQVAMKGKGVARRTDGTMFALQTEVAATIARGDYLEIITDISNLQTSISSRNDDNGKFTPHTPDWDSHRARIDDEKDCLTLLKAEKTRLESLKAKPAKAAAKAAPSNPFAALGADEDDSETSSQQD
jgi:hypothetical protein